MYSIYLKNYYQDNKLITDETLLYTVPIDSDQYDNVLTEPTVSTEVGKTGTFEFTMNPNHPYYHAIAQMRTIMRVEYDGDTIFHGRILTVDNTLAGVKKVHCEGDMSFLLDSFQLATEKASRKKITLGEYLEKILEAHNKQMNEEGAALIIKAELNLADSNISSPGYTQPGTSNGNNNFPGRVSEEDIAQQQAELEAKQAEYEAALKAAEEEAANYVSDKCIYPGYLPGFYPDEFPEDQQIEDETDTFGSDSHQQTMSALEDLTKRFGGFFRTRYEAEDGKIYLDWCRNWFWKDIENSQPIAITKNIIDAQSNSEVDNIFTALIPVGKKKAKDIFIKGYKEDIHGKGNNRILVPQITKVFSDEELDTGYVNKNIFAEAINRYGIIYKVQNFSNADTQEKLWNYACDWIRHNYIGGITSYDLSAVDMHHVNGEIEKYIVGDCIELTLPSDMTEHDEYNPDKRSSSILRTLMSAKYVLHNPDKNSYTAGIPNDILNLEYGTKSTSKSTSGGGGGKGAGAKGGPKPPKDGGGGGDDDARLQALDSLAYELALSSSYNFEEFAALEKKNDKAASAALQSTKIVVKKILDDPTFDEQKLTTMVMDGEKGKLSMIQPSDAQEIFYRMFGDGWQNNPAYLNMIATNESLVNVTNSMLLDAGNKAFELRGNTSMTKEQAVAAYDQLKDQLTGNETPEEIAVMMEDLTGDVVDPNIVASITVTVDEQGNESGKIDLSKEDHPTVDLDGGGNDGTGALHIGNEHGGTDWLINMNEPLQYEDDKGVMHTIPNGTIDASDYAIIKGGLKSVPSFKTQVAVFKTAIADNLTAINIHAEKIEAIEIDVRTIKANYISTNYLSSNNISVKGLTITSGSFKLAGATVTPKKLTQIGADTFVLTV